MPLGQLECLLLDFTSFDDEGMKHLTLLKRVRQLPLGGTAISDGGMASLEGLPNLRHLSVAKTKVSDMGLRHLSGLPRIEKLDIPETRATNSCLRILSAIPSLKNVLVGDTAISPSAPGFVGVLNDDLWYPNELKAKRAEETSKDEQYPEDGDLPCYRRSQRIGAQGQNGGE